MVPAEAIQRNWSKVRSQLETRWESLAGDDLGRFRGNVDSLVGEIQRKTGETRQTIEDYLEHLTGEGASAVGRAGEAAKQYAIRAAGDVAAAPGRLAQETRRWVRKRPVESLTVAFAVGLIAAVGVGLLMRRR